MAKDKKIPGAADSALRMFYALKAGGHETAVKLTELLGELGELEHKGAIRDLHLERANGSWKKPLSRRRRKDGAAFAVRSKDVRGTGDGSVAARRPGPSTPAVAATLDFATGQIL
jgi:hypothetical protein